MRDDVGMCDAFVPRARLTRRTPRHYPRRALQPRSEAWWWGHVVEEEVVATAAGWGACHGQILPADAGRGLFWALWGACVFHAQPLPKFFHSVDASERPLVSPVVVPVYRSEVSL